MKRIGLTGGIGSGKTTVARIFSVLGIPVYNSDDRARELTNYDPEIKWNLKAVFGEHIFDENDILKRSDLANIVFSSAPMLHSLNKIIHPAVAKDFDRWSAMQHSPFVIKEAAIIFETGLNKTLDLNIVVSAPESLRIKRTMERNGLTEFQVRERMLRQWPEERLTDLADYVIINDESELVIPQVHKIYNSIISNENP